MPHEAEGSITLEAPLTVVPGIGPRRAESLRELGIRNIGQLIAYLPARHEREEAEAPISQLKPESIVSARGLVSATRVVAKGNRPRFEAVLIDDTGRIDLTWFNGLYLKDKIKPGLRMRVKGKARRFGPGLQIANPKHEILGADDSKDPGAHEARLRPIYPASEAMPSHTIEITIDRVLDRALPLIADHLDPRYCAERGLLELAEAYRLIHRPSDEEQAAAARRRLAYDELLMLQLAVQMKRAERMAGTQAPALSLTPKIDKAIRARFPFALTPAQDRVVREIAADLQKPTPANRLIQGDVGSGKTVVALYAMLMSVAGKHQAALMAPTELLAEQHMIGISRMLAGSSVRIALLTGSLPARERAALLARIAKGEVDLIIGTHALLTETVRFHSLAAIIIDEQHRFGVHQRAALRSKGDDASARPLAPHTLVMTATPIPRTLALTLFGDLDVSTIDELPPGRKKIATRVVSPASRHDVYAYLAKRIDEGDQAYVVVPAIDSDAEEGIEGLREGIGEGIGEGTGGSRDHGIQGTEASSNAIAPLQTSLRSVAQVASDLSLGSLKGKRIGQVHGRLKRDAREAVMDAFRRGEIDCLVATTVIEVGVDVPNANVIVIEDAERFGLAQLHQLRGRVGRAGKSSVCILIGAPITEGAEARLSAIARMTDGFKLAERDFELRGFGDVIGLRQSGLPPFKVVDLSKDLDLLTLAKRDAEATVSASPNLSTPAHALLRRRVLRAHGKWIGLADVG